MKKTVLIIIVLLVFITGCNKNKSNAKYIKDEYNDDLKILYEMDVNNREYYENGLGFHYIIEYFILDIDEKNELKEVYSTPPEFHITDLNSKHKYYRLYTQPFIIKVNNSLYKKKNYNYNVYFLAQITEPKKIWNKKYTKDMNIEEFYNKKIKSIVDKYLNKALDKAIKDKEIINGVDIKELCDEFDNLTSEEQEKNGFTIKIQNVEFINK